MMSNSVIKNSGNLRAYYHKWMAFDKYSDGEWQKERIVPLTMQEKKVLIFARQGKINKEISVCMNIENQSIRNIERSIYRKFSVNTMAQAVTFAVNHHLIYRTDKQVNMKKSANNNQRRPMTSDKLPRIQGKLNRGQSVNSISEQEDISEFTIRYAIKTGKLIRESSSGS